MNHINNDTDHILIRKTRNILIVVGTGTIMFSVWTVVKTLSSIFLLRDEAIAAARKTVDEIGLVVPDQQLFFIALVTVLISMILFLTVRIYIGMAAISEGRGSRRRKGYLLLAVLMIIFNITAIVINFISVNPQESLGAFSHDTSLSSLIIELTSMVMIVEMVFAAVRLRRACIRVSQSAEQKEQE